MFSGAIVIGALAFWAFEIAFVFALGAATSLAESSIPPLQAGLATPCVTPMLDPPSFWCSGVYGLVDAPRGEIEDAFPQQWQGRTRLGVGLDVRPPGFVMRFEHTARVYRWPWEPYMLAFEPPLRLYEVTEVDSVLVNWQPIPGYEWHGTTFFGGDCGLFDIAITDTVYVWVEATVNLAAIYASPGDTIQVWGAELGLADVLLRGEGVTGPIAVASTTWGQVKHAFSPPRSWRKPPAP